MALASVFALLYIALAKLMSESFYTKVISQSVRLGDEPHLGLCL
jgi:hypothetical protein